MKKILHIPNYYPPHVGGIEDVCYNIIRGLPEYEHRVICFNDEKVTRKDTYENTEVVRCGVWKKLFSQSISFSFYAELKKVLKEFDPDIVHFHTPNPLVSVYLLLLLPKKKRLIVHWHSDIVEQDLLLKFYNPIEKRLVKRADVILVTSPTYIPGSKALRGWESKIVVVPNTVNTEKLQKKPGDEERIQEIRNLYPAKKIVFTFGRHVHYKGYKYLVDAAPLVSDKAVIVIAGRGPLSHELKKRSVSPAVYFPGRLTDDDLRCYLYASDIFAFPSITRNEAFGIALAEAMYCGLPAVTFTIPDSGVNWLCINGETGLESENENIKDLAGAINNLIENASLRKQLGENAVKRIRDFFVFDVIKERLVAYVYRQ
jgi:glycosyltransferase involved in cell wall biosynthesis